MNGHAPQDVWRLEAPHVLGALVRKYGDFAACEDAVQEALFAAAQQWPADGLPDKPRAWLIRVASRKLIDACRSESARADREERLGAMAPVHAPAADEPGPAEFDDTLLLLALCCHPALTLASRVALTLRAVGGLSTDQIAAAFLVPSATMGQRITRAKKTLREAGARFDQPQDEVLARVGDVRHVLYLVFNEGYTASAGDGLIDASVTGEAIRLTRQLHRLRPDDDETAGLLALMLLTESRSQARTDDGELVPLADQDRGRWNRDLIAEGVAIVERVLPRGPVGPFQLQAAIAAVHAESPSPGETDWKQITILYRMLASLDDSPVVRLNLAVAVGMSQGPKDGLELVESLLREDAMARHHRTHAVRAHLLEAAGQLQAAAQAYAEAASLTRSLPEQRYLNRRAAIVDGG